MSQDAVLVGAPGFAPDFAARNSWAVGVRGRFARQPIGRGHPMSTADKTLGLRMPGSELPGFDWLFARTGPVEPVDAVVSERLLREAATLASSGSIARQTGDEATSDACFRAALAVAMDAVSQLDDSASAPCRSRVLRTAACLALSCGEVATARRLAEDAAEFAGAGEETDAWSSLREAAAWPDAWLVAAVRREPPDTEALDVLASRYWKPLFGRCELLTLDRQKAGDLAQEAWRKVLRTRQALKPGGNFPAYLNTVATNIWRDWHRAARRAGSMADDRMASLDASVTTDDGGTIVLGEMIPDLNALSAEAQRRLMLDIDRALEQLTPHLREVLVSRFLNEESCAEIGRRVGRTEQTVSAWVREAVRQMKHFLEIARPDSAAPKEPT